MERVKKDFNGRKNVFCSVRLLEIRLSSAFRSELFLPQILNGRRASLGKNV